MDKRKRKNKGNWGGKEHRKTVEQRMAVKSNEVKQKTTRAGKRSQFILRKNKSE